MTHRLTYSMLWWLLLVLIVLAMTGCSASSTSSATSSSAAVVSLAPAPASPGLARTDPAVWAAVRFEQVHCAWDWRPPLADYVTAQQALATPAYGKQLAAGADPTSWREEVVAGQQQVTCTVSTPHRLVGPPSTSRSVYVRMSVNEQITSTMGSFDGGQSIASWRVQNIAGLWLVAGPFQGG